LGEVESRLLRGAAVEVLTAKGSHSSNVSTVDRLLVDSEARESFGDALVRGGDWCGLGLDDFLPLSLADFDRPDRVDNEEELLGLEEASTSTAILGTPFEGIEGALLEDGWSDDDRGVTFGGA